MSLEYASNQTGLHPHLLEGEQVLWTGRPELMKWGVRRVGMAAWLFFATVFLAVWIGTLLRDTRGLPCLLLPGGIWASILLYRIAQIAKIVSDGGQSAVNEALYALTDRRVIAVYQGKDLTVRSLPLGDIGNSPWNPRGDGSGSVTFYRKGLTDIGVDLPNGKGSLFGKPKLREDAVTFDDVADVYGLRRKVLAARENWLNRNAIP